MATQKVAETSFTRWHRSMDDGGLILVREAGGKVAEWIELDIADLPTRPDLLSRLGPHSRARLLAEVD